MKLRLASRIVLSFMPLAVLVLTIVGASSYRSGRNNLEAAVISELVTKAIEKEAALDIWIEGRLSEIRQIAIQSDVVDKAAKLIAAVPGSEEARSAHAILLRELEPYLTGARAAYVELFVMTPESGKVVASTSPAEEGKSKRGHSYFDNGKTELYLEAPYYSADTQAPAMTDAVPLHAPDGRVVAVLATRLNLAAMNTIVQRRTGLRRTEDSFLVNAEQYPVTQPRFIREPIVLRRKLDTDAVRRCVARNSGVALTTDYRGVPSIAVYRWDAKYQLGLITKIDQAEALAPVRVFGWSLILIICLALLATAGTAILLARTITQPLRTLRDSVRRFSEGNIHGQFLGSPNDEVGLLAYEFKQMSARVAARTAELEKTNNLLQAEIAERKQLEQQVLLAANAFASISESILITDADKKIIFVNEAFVTVSGYEIEEVIGRTPAFLHSGRHDAAFYADMWRQMVATDRWQGEVWDRHKNGNLFPILLSLSTVRNSDGAITHYVGVESDISDSKRYESQLKHQAQHDALTGLPNRVLFRIRLEAALARAGRSGKLLGILFIDLDRFKIVNDTRGHAIGDALLRSVGDRLGRCIRATDTAARFGGDEFAVLIDLLESRSSPAIVAQKILGALATVFVIDSHELEISASIGISTFPYDGNDAETLLRNADSAMYAAKESGRNAFRFFSE